MSPIPGVRVFDSVIQPTLRACVGLLSALLAVCLVTGSASAAPAVQLDVVPDGNGTISLDPLPFLESDCSATVDPASGTVATVSSCPYEYPRGQEVTLTATPNAPGVTFEGWSDERCPGRGACTLFLDTDQTVTALFSPQYIKVSVAGLGNVTADTGATCQPITPSSLNCGPLPIFSRVTLLATPDLPGDRTTWVASACDAPRPQPGERECVVSVYGPTSTSVGFGHDPGGDRTPAISVRFRILKSGTGWGTVRGGPLDCGNTCTLDENFGRGITLRADPARGSTFVRWRGACGAAPTCSLAVGPVTAVVAVFDEEGPSHPESPTSAPGTVRPRPTFVVQMPRMAVNGHGRNRRIFMRVALNAPATVRGTLSRGRRRVASWRWRVAAGRPLLRAPVPARVAKGVYKLRLSFRSRASETKRITRRIRLPG